MLRQEDVYLSAAVDASAPLPVNVVTQVYRGADVVYVVEALGTRLRVVAPSHATPVPAGPAGLGWRTDRSEEHTSELQSLMRISYAVFCLKKKNTHKHTAT